MSDKLRCVLLYLIGILSAIIVYLLYTYTLTLFHIESKDVKLAKQKVVIDNITTINQELTKEINRTNTLDTITTTIIEKHHKDILDITIKKNNLIKEKPLPKVYTVKDISVTKKDIVTVDFNLSEYKNFGNTTLTDIYDIYNYVKDN